MRLFLANLWAKPKLSAKSELSVKPWRRFVTSVVLFGLVCVPVAGTTETALPNTFSVRANAVNTLPVVTMAAANALQTESQQGRCRWPDAGSLNAIVAVAGEDGSYASGVVINPNRVLTAAHALSPAHKVFVNIDNRYRAAKIVMIDRSDDLAMLAVDTSGVTPLHVASADPVADEAVWAVGFPRASDKETTPGRLTRNNAGSLHASAGIDLGQSGGGLLFCKNGSYQLGGMLRGYGAYVQGDRFVKLRNHSVSVGASTIQRFFNAIPQNATFSAAMVTR